MESLLTTILTSNILPYWLRMQDPVGGFYGRVSLQNEPIPAAERGCVLNARILWTFSSAYRVLGVETYRQAAEHAYKYFVNNFIDYRFGGTYWSVSFDGTSANDRKQTYAMAFAIYGLCAYYRMSHCPEALEHARTLYRDIEDYASDGVYGGYIEARSRDWHSLSDMRLSTKDINAPKSQNTHLHILEAYTELYRVWPNMALRNRIISLIEIFRTHMIQPETGHLDLFFEMDWKPVEPRHCSYGHEIEASWLIDEAAKVVGVSYDTLVVGLADVAAEGLQLDGSMVHEDVDSHREWWVEAEAVVGYANIYRRFGDIRARNRADKLLNYICTHLMDHDNGEWYWDCDDTGRPNLNEPKAGFWKCPYHNSRMCLQLI